MVMNFIVSMVITIMVCFALGTIRMDHNFFHGDLIYVGALFGMYIFAYFNVNRIIDEKIIPENAYRFILAIVCIVIFNLAFIYLMPLVLGPNVFPNPHPISDFGYAGAGSDFMLGKETYLGICSVIVFIANCMAYRKSS